MGWGAALRNFNRKVIELHWMGLKKQWNRGECETSHSFSSPSWPMSLRVSASSSRTRCRGCLGRPSSAWVGHVEDEVWVNRLHSLVALLHKGLCLKGTVRQSKRNRSFEIVALRCCTAINLFLHLRLPVPFLLPSPSHRLLPLQLEFTPVVLPVPDYFLRAHYCSLHLFAPTACQDMIRFCPVCVHRVRRRRDRCLTHVRLCYSFCCPHCGNFWFGDPACRRPPSVFAWPALQIISCLSASAMRLPLSLSAHFAHAPIRSLCSISDLSTFNHSLLRFILYTRIVVCYLSSSSVWSIIRQPSKPTIKRSTPTTKHKDFNSFKPRLPIYYRSSD